MQYIHKPFFGLIGPVDLRKRQKRYFSLLKENNFSLKKNMDESEAQDIYTYYKNNKTDKELGFNTADTKRRLLKCGRYRCCFCGRYIQESNEADESYRCFTIEHFKEECRYPLMILDWKNLFPSCDECNGNRNDTPIDFYNPSSFRFKKYLKSLTYSYSGYIYSRHNVLDSYLLAYQLNSKSLVLERSRFYFQMINPNFEILLKLEANEPDKIKKAILFVDEYFSVIKAIKSVKNGTNKLLSIAKEVLNDAQQF